MTNKRPPLQPLGHRQISDLLRSLSFPLKVGYQVARVELIFIACLALVASAFPAAQAAIWRELINAATHFSDGSSGAEAQSLFFWIGASVLLTVIQIIVSQANKYLSKTFQLKLQIKISVDTFRQAARLDLYYFENPEFEDVIDRAKRDIATYVSRLLLNFFSILQLVLQTIAICVFLISIDAFALVVVLPITLPYLWYQWRFAQVQYRKDYLQTTRRRWLNFFANCVMNYELIPEVKIDNLPPYLERRYTEILHEFDDEERTILIKYDVIGDTFFEFVFAFGMYLILAYAGLRVVAGNLLIGDLIVFARTATQLQNFMKNGSSIVNTMAQDALYVTDWYKFMSAKSNLENLGENKLDHVHGRIDIRNATFAYPGSVETTLKNVSFVIEAGETVALVGANGAGKSTLAKVIARFYPLDRGSICLDGQDISEIELNQYYNQIAYVPQYFNRFEASAADNIAFGDWERLINNRAEIQSIAERTGIHELIMQMPNGYDTMLGRRFGTYDLSGGQWQKIAIARALGRNTPIVILDEPTSSLDAQSEYEIFSHFREMAQGRTTILISHRFSTISMADRIIVMHQGQIVENGTHAELVAANGYYATMYNLYAQQLDQHTATTPDSR